MKASTSFRYFSSVFFFFILFIVAAKAQCVYRLGVRTGTIQNSGTDSRISISMSARSGAPFTISDLKAWGVEKPGHDYFESGNTDFFVVNGPCIPTRVCRITVTSDGTGDYPGWYLVSVEITITPNRGPATRIFGVNQWLSPAPYQLSVTRDSCASVTSVSEGGEEGLDIAN